MLVGTPSRLSRGEELYRGDVTGHLVQKWGHMPGLLPPLPPPAQSSVCPGAHTTSHLEGLLPTTHLPPSSTFTCISHFPTGYVFGPTVPSLPPGRPSAAHHQGSSPSSAPTESSYFTLSCSGLSSPSPMGL